MASNICMNTSCGATSSIEWRKGWGLRSGGFASLCDKCGFAYKQFIFCDTFHLKESGWRECISCGKHLHCGCIVSKSFLELLDNGGVECISCAKSSEHSSIPSDESPNRFGTSPVNNVSGALSTSVDNEVDGVDKGKLVLLGKRVKGNGWNRLLQFQQNDTDGSIGQIKRVQVIPPVGEAESVGFSTSNQEILGTSQVSQQDINRETVGVKEMYESPAQTCLSITLGAPSRTPNSVLPIPGVVVEAREQSNIASPSQQVQKSHHLVSKPSKMGPGIGSEVSNDTLPQVRVARQPVDGRGRNQLLPRYWPRITDQELRQISGASNSTIVPLFEKVLSASDAGRIGRLVLPKACAEAYFPPISQPEGLPLKIQDAKGNEWLFQFRFWPNNNSRMYVLEGVAPCIQSMQLQAGDTVTFSRIDPQRKLVIGFRKAFSSTTMQTPKGGTNTNLSALSKHFNSADGDISFHQTEKQTKKNGDWSNGSFPLQPLLVPEKKRSRNIGSKSKRLVIGSEDALELKLTWEEAQDLLRPPPTVKPSIVMIEGYEFEEYEEPPVFGKKTIFTSRTSGEQDQWAQCDSCFRWRRLPADVLIPPNWSCADNDWDSKRYSCSAPDEMSPKELDDLLGLSRDFKKRRISATNKPAQECETSALEALATAAVLGEDGGDSGTSSVLTTTKHPRHRSGCTCIVCIQAPSGKGPKHKPTCTCNVCMTVKRRFETLMMRKKKRQSTHEADIPQRKFHIWGPKDDEAEVESASNCALLPLDLSENEVRQTIESESGSLGKIQVDTSKGQIDLNCHPSREDDLQAGSEQVSMMGLLQEASLPLEMYLRQNGLTSLSMHEQQVSSSSHALPQVTEESDGRPPDNGNLTSVTRTEEEGGNEGCCEPDQDPK